MPLGGPRLPYLLTFPEANVRTYVVGPDQRPGIFFFSLDAPRLVGVAGGRLTYGLPYRHRPVSITRRESTWESTSQTNRMVLEIGDRVTATPLDLFLTERYTLFHELGPALLRSEVEHPPWQLHAARIVELDQCLVAGSAVLAHFSPGVHANFAWPKRIAREQKAVLV